MNIAATQSPQQEFGRCVAAICEAIQDRPLDCKLQSWLAAEYPPQSPIFRKLASLIAVGVEQGWLCGHEAEGIRFGRVIKPGGIAGRFSVDVVMMESVVGPHHAHPAGEIGMIVPISGEPNFDGFPEGWYVYGPGSDHFPTVADGIAYVLYLLPDGAIEFTGRAHG